jgi:hypothetical protein
MQVPYGHRRNVLCVSLPAHLPPTFFNLFYFFNLFHFFLKGIKEAFAADYRLLPGMHFTVVDIASDSSVGQGLVG